MANLIALVYNWCHLYVRLYDGDHHREAITSRPALFGGVARLIRHSAQRTIKASLQHEKADLLTRAISMVIPLLLYYTTSGYCIRDCGERGENSGVFVVYGDEAIGTG